MSANFTTMVPTDYAIARDLQLVQATYLGAQQANLRVDRTVARIRREHNLTMTWGQLVAGIRNGQHRIA